MVVSKKEKPVVEEEGATREHPHSPRLKAKREKELKEAAAKALEEFALDEEPVKKSRKKAEESTPVKKSRKKVVESESEEEVATPKKKPSKKKVEEVEEEDVKPTPAKKKKADDADPGLPGSVALSEVEGLGELSKKALIGKGINSLFEIQAKCFQPISTGQDVLGQARTGCGKTLAFVLPLCHRLSEDKNHRRTARSPRALCLAPTRELAKQIAEVAKWLGESLRLKATCFYGGTLFGPQCDELRSGVDVLVATPGRLLDHIQRETLSLGKVETVVLDEADEMLSMGFKDDVESTLQSVKLQRGGGEDKPPIQVLLFSATVPKWVSDLAERYMSKKKLAIKTSDLIEEEKSGKGKDDRHRVNPNIKHYCLPCPPAMRADCLADIIKVQAGQFGKTLVFTDTKAEANDLVTNAQLVQMSAQVLHGDIPQNQREVVMDAFRCGKVRVLIATDVAARGLDVPNVQLVIMTHPPMDVETYVHRSGRTARAGKKGSSVVFYTLREECAISRLSKVLSVTFDRISPPQPKEIVASTARDAVLQLDRVPAENVEFFSETANALIEERGAEAALAAALAAMSGYTNVIPCRSLLSSYLGNVAVLLESEQQLETTGKGWYLIRQNFPPEVAEQARGLTLLKGRMGCVFDVPQNIMPVVKAAQMWKTVTMTVPTELPELEPREDEASQEQQWWQRKTQFAAKIWAKREGERGGKGKGKSGKGGDGGKGKGKGGKSGGKGKGGDGGPAAKRPRTGA